MFKYSQHRRQWEEQENLEWKVVTGWLDVCYNRSEFCILEIDNFSSWCPVRFKLTRDFPDLQNKAQAIPTLQPIYGRAYLQKTHIYVEREPNFWTL